MRKKKKEKKKSHLLSLVGVGSIHEVERRDPLRLVVEGHDAHVAVVRDVVHHEAPDGLAQVLPAPLRKSSNSINPFVPTVPTFAVRETASLGIMGEPRVPPLNPSETIVF